jgi:hypothetical protein
MAKILFCLSILIGWSQHISAKEWRGIVPSRSTRGDVSRLLGQCSDPNLRCAFSLEEEDVYMVFSSLVTDYHECAKHLPADTVLLIEVTPKTEFQLSDFQIEEKKFRKFDPASPPGLGFAGYISEEEGVVFKTYKGKVQQVDYFAAAKDKHLCSTYYESPETFIQMIVDFFSKFDEWGDLVFSDEKARLDNVAIQLKQQPTDIVYLMIYAGQTACVGEAKARGIRAKKHLMSRQIAPSRIVWIDGGYRQDLTTEVWISPPNIAKPSVNPELSLKPADVTLERNCKIKRPASHR